MEETPVVSMEEPSFAATVSADENTENTLNGGSHSPASDGAALAENDLLGFAMPPSGKESTDDPMGFSTPQETLASSTDLLDFVSAPTSMRNTPETGDVAVEPSPEVTATEDLLGFGPAPDMTTAPQNEEISIPVEQATMDNDETLLDFMSSAPPAQDTTPSNAADVVPSQSEVLLDVLSSGQPAATESEPIMEADGTSVEQAATEGNLKDDAAEDDTLAEQRTEQRTEQSASYAADLLTDTAPSQPETLTDGASRLENDNDAAAAAAGQENESTSLETPSPPVTPATNIVNDTALSQSETLIDDASLNHAENENEEHETAGTVSEEVSFETPSPPVSWQSTELNDAQAIDQVGNENGTATSRLKDETTDVSEVALETASPPFEQDSVEANFDPAPSTESEVLAAPTETPSVGVSDEPAAQPESTDKANGNSAVEQESDSMKDVDMKTTDAVELESDSMQDVDMNVTDAVDEESESMEDVDIDVTDTVDNESLHAEGGMAEVALEVQSPVVAASTEQSVLSESVTKQVQQVDPWQTEDVVDNTETISKGLAVPLTDETKAQLPPESASRPTMVDIPPKEENQQSSDAEKDAVLVELQSSLQEHMTRQAEAEDRARMAEARMKQLEQEVQAKEKAEADLEAMKERMKSVVSDKAHLEMELAKLRAARDEHERKEIVLSNRLNAAKKKEAVKADLAERLEDEVKALQTELSTTKEKLAESQGSGQQTAKSLEETTRQMTERVRLAETALADERRLNEDRKKKMKAFIESKQEEVRQGKVQTDELNAELEQTNRLLREQTTRWKQLHAQWVQSQTRNRELQRDLNRIKKDSDNMHKIGDKMEMKLSKSAQETEEHKNKRLTAKHELMTILRTLECEREVSSKLRDSLKFTFTPKALSQQQLLKESLKELDSELEKLSRRLGRPLPPSIDSPALFADDDEAEVESAALAEGVAEEGGDGSLNRPEIDSNHLISNLDNETQRVSQCIMALTSGIERMHVILDEAGPSNCINSLTTILMGGAPPASGSVSQESSNRGAMRSTRYGQVPTSY